jgi:hypothetical protein
VFWQVEVYTYCQTRGEQVEEETDLDLVTERNVDNGGVYVDGRLEGEWL